MNEEQKAIVRNIDAFVSAATGAGVAGMDKFRSYYFLGESDLDDETLLALYTDNDLAASIVERIVHDALRSGYELDWQGATDEQRRDVRDWAESTYRVTEEVMQARVWARLFGGGAVFMGIEGEPSNRAIMGQEVRFLRAVPSPELPGWTWYSDPTLQDFGQVSTYMLHTPSFRYAGEGVGAPVKRGRQQNFSQIEIHESRCVPFYGTKTTDRQQWQDQGWGKSVLHRVYNVLLKFEAAYDSVLHTLAEQSVPVYKVKALLDLLASENGELLAKRFELINTGKGAYRAVILDQEEDLERVEASLSEASNVVDAAMVRVSAAAGIPVTLLFGRSPAGQNATGKSDLENWNQQVSSEQHLILGPAIVSVYRNLLAQPDSPLNGRVPDDLKAEFPAVETLGQQEAINAYAQQAGADVGYIGAGVLTAAQVAMARAQQPGPFPKVDMKFLRELQELEEERLLNPPDPMALEPEPEEDEPEEDRGDSEEVKKREDALANALSTLISGGALEFYHYDHEEEVNYPERDAEDSTVAEKASQAKYAKKNKAKIRAKDIARAAVKSGRLKKKPCANCGAKNSEMHHSNYDKPLQVQWLCPTCHGKLHAKQ